MKKIKLISIIFAILLFFTFSISSFADFGDYAGDSDYGSYGDSYGGYDYNYDYDYDDDDDDDDYNYNYNYGGSTTSSGGGSSPGITPLGIFSVIVIIAVVIIVRKGLNGTLGTSSKSKNKAVMPGATATNASSLRPIADYASVDPDFNQAEFTEKLANLYVRFQNAWTDKDLEPLRPYLTDAFFNQVDRQLDRYRQNNHTNRVEKIAVLGVDLVGWKQEGDMDIMIARLRTRIVDYVVDDGSGIIVSGDNKTEKFMDYEWSVVRTTGTTTAKAGEFQAKACPHCGAPISINQSTKCEYCGSILTTDEYNWAVNSIKGIAQRSQK